VTRVTFRGYSIAIHIITAHMNRWSSLRSRYFTRKIVIEQKPVPPPLESFTSDVSWR